jgi:esterase/lipase superfamily enzyme
MTAAGQRIVSSIVLCGLLVGSVSAARVRNLDVEPKSRQKQHLLNFDLLFDPGETAVELEVLALEFRDGATPPLSPIGSNNPSRRGPDGQYLAKTVIQQKDGQRLQPSKITVLLDDLRLAQGLHQIAYQLRVFQDGKAIEHVCAAKVMVSVGKPPRIVSQRTENVTITEVKPQRQTIEVERTIDGQVRKERQEIVARVPVTRQVKQQVIAYADSAYSDVFAFAPPPEIQVDDPNIAAQIEQTQMVPWTPPRAIPINFATTRNIVKPTARDATRFGNEVGQLSYGTALIDISVSKTHGERPPSQEPVRPTPQESFKVSNVSSLSENDFFQAISNALWNDVGTGPTTKDDVVIFIHGYNNSFRFSCVRFAQLVYDTRFEGKPVLFSWPSNGGDSLVDEIAGIASYGSDQADAKASVESLAQVLRDVAADRRKPDGAPAKRGDIHLVAHSMGCQLLVDALDKLKPEWPAGSHPFKSIILAAPDVDSEDLTRLVQCVRTPAERVTLYFCQEDRALWASSQYHARQAGGVLRNRLGQALCILPKIENIDANAANTTFIGHSYFVDGSLVLRDLEDIVQRNYAPELRVLCPDNKMPEKYAYWKIIDDKTQCKTAATTAVDVLPAKPAKPPK